jgi:hypothetical protein
LGLPNPDFGFELGATTNPKSAFRNPKSDQSYPSSQRSVKISICIAT